MGLVVWEKLRGCLLVAGRNEAGLTGIDAVDPRSRVSVGVQGGRIAPLRELGAIPRRHVIDVLGHLHGEVVLSDELRVAGPELKEMLLELVVPEKRV